MTDDCDRCQLDMIKKRVREKRRDYIRYDFSPRKNDVLKAFFDLSQEFDAIEDFYLICVIVLHESFNVDCRLILINDKAKELEMVCDSEHGLYNPAKIVEIDRQIMDKPWEKDQSFFVPIFCRELTFSNISNNKSSLNLGMLEVSPLSKLTSSDKFFLSKYTNRIGSNLRKRKLAQQNVSHLKFISNLVSDIEHNVIIPNMYFKHLFRQLRNRILELSNLKQMVNQGHQHGADSEMCKAVFEKISNIQDDLDCAYNEIDKHHINCSMFLESLLRRDHFEKGHLVLQSKILNVDKEIIRPQLEHYMARLVARGITVRTPVDLPQENYKINADLGLLAQVYANLFSNAVKYTREIIDRNGNPRKVMAYGRKMLINYYGKGNHGVKFNVFTTGPHLSDEVAEKSFHDGFRGEDSFSSNSRGHGLAFVKYVIEIHGGEVGYDKTEQGNNFFFILPLVC